MSSAAPAVFLDLRLPSFGMGTVDLNEVPGFKMLLEDVQNHRYGVVFIDLDEDRPGLTPDYESGFVRHMLEAADATALNAYTDDKGAFAEELLHWAGATLGLLGLSPLAQIGSLQDSFAQFWSLA